MAIIQFENQRVVWGSVGFVGEGEQGNVVLGAEALVAGAETGLLTNTAIGASALKAASVGASGNVAVGNVALTGTTTGSNNVAVGKEALSANKAGGGNTVVGAKAMANSVGVEETTANVAVGEGSLLRGVGKGNVSVGTTALFENETGNGNVAIGNEAGEKELGSNKLYIANSGTETPLIKGDFSAKTLTINGTLTTNQVAPIEVAAGVVYEVLKNIQGLWKENISVQGTLNLQGRFDEVGVTESSPWFLPAPVAPTSNVVIPANTQTWFYLNAAVEGTIDLQGQLVGIG